VWEGVKEGVCVFVARGKGGIMCVHVGKGKGGIMRVYLGRG